MNIIEIQSASAMWEHTKIREVEIKQERAEKQRLEDLKKEKEFYEIIERIKSEIQKASHHGQSSCSFTLMEGELYGRNRMTHIEKIKEMFQMAGYSVSWHEYSRSWTYRSGKDSEFSFGWYRKEVA